MPSSTCVRSLTCLPVPAPCSRYSAYSWTRNSGAGCGVSRACRSWLYRQQRGRRGRSCAWHRPALGEPQSARSMQPGSDHSSLLPWGFSLVREILLRFGLRGSMAVLREVARSIPGTIAANAERARIGRRTGNPSFCLSSRNVLNFELYRTDLDRDTGKLSFGQTTSRPSSADLCDQKNLSSTPSSIRRVPHLAVRARPMCAGAAASSPSAVTHQCAFSR